MRLLPKPRVPWPSAGPSRRQATGLTVCLETCSRGAARELEQVHPGPRRWRISPGSMRSPATGGRAVPWRRARWRSSSFATSTASWSSSARASSGGGQHRRACRIDHDRARIARLTALMPEPPPTMAAMADAPAAAAPDEDAAMIQETTWRAVEIDGEPVADGVEITLEHRRSCSVRRHLGGCNRYFGTARGHGRADRLRPGWCHPNGLPGAGDERGAAVFPGAGSGHRLALEDDVLELRWTMTVPSECASSGLTADRPSRADSTPRAGVVHPCPQRPLAVSSSWRTIHGHDHARGRARPPRPAVQPAEHERRDRDAGDRPGAEGARGRLHVQPLPLREGDHRPADPGCQGPEGRWASTRSPSRPTTRSAIPRTASRT
jgi:hypothetical protein